MTPKSAITTTTTAQDTTPETTMTPKSTTATATTVSLDASTPAGLAALVAELSATLDAAESRLGPEAPAMTAVEKKRTAKPRRGSDKMLTQIAPVVVQFGLNSDSLNTTQMLAQHQIAQTLLPLQARLQKITKRVDDEVFSAQTGSWEIGLQLYSMLQRRAKSNGDIAKAIEPLVKGFSYRNPAVKKQSKETTQAKTDLKHAIAIATKHGVSLTLAPNGGVQGVAGAPAAVAAAQAELATAGVGAAQVQTQAQTAGSQGAAAAPGANAGGGAGGANGGAGAPVAPLSSAGPVSAGQGGAGH